MHKIITPYVPNFPKLSDVEEFLDPSLPFRETSKLKSEGIMLEKSQEFGI